MGKSKMVYPHPDLAARREYLPGVGADGAELPAKEADDLVKRGLAVYKQDPHPPFHNAGLPASVDVDYGAPVAAPPAPPEDADAGASEEE